MQNSALLVADFFNYCVADPYILEGAVIIALIVACVVALGSLSLYGISRIAKVAVTYPTSLQLCLIVGAASLVTTLVLSVIDFCFFIDESLYLAIVILVTVVMSIGTFRRRTRVPLLKSAIIALTALTISYLVAALVISSLPNTWFS